MASCFQDVPWKLYSSRMISAWGDRMWMFAVGLFMVELSPSGSLKWPAIYGLTKSLAVVILGSSIGRWIDRTSRWNAAHISLAAQNVLVVICAVCVAVTFYFKERLVAEADGWGLTAACSVIVILGTLAHLASVATSIAVFKDWIVIIAGGDSQTLARMNSTCRSIDLATNMIAPIAVGQVMYFLSHIVAAVTIASWNVLSFFIEGFLLWRIYKEFPNLAVKTSTREKQPLQVLESGEKDLEPGDQPTADDATVKIDSGKGFFAKRFGGFLKSWKIYFSHEVRNAGIGLACLYMTVLGFDSITMGYAYSQGVPESILGILLAVGAAVGLLGSVVFPFLVRCMGVERTGLYGFALEIACLTLCVASVWAPGTPFDPASVSISNLDNPFALKNSSRNSTAGSYEDGPESYTSVILLMAGIILARFGLWVADLSVNQVLQQVDDQIRGSINGVQSSMNMIFDTAKFLLVIACPWPQTFGILVCISFSAICAGWSFFASYSFKKRGHLLPFHGVIDNIPPEEIHQISVDLKNEKPDENTVVRRNNIIPSSPETKHDNSSS
ncbi:putative ferroportin [Daphnia pulex]|uniref:Solute carrier family 40 member n=1 Tax=Daphnia pulex TaxID=6669 RepID=E9HD28_DAPPU|nr:putative ferroportin [Daphnia pulex]|eukprot:EFX70364.1 putative ferroportin [Daphnia pulex]